MLLSNFCPSYILDITGDLVSFVIPVLEPMYLFCGARDAISHAKPCI